MRRHRGCAGRNIEQFLGRRIQFEQRCQFELLFEQRLQQFVVERFVVQQFVIDREQLLEQLLLEQFVRFEQFGILRRIDCRTGRT